MLVWAAATHRGVVRVRCWNEPSEGVKGVEPGGEEGRIKWGETAPEGRDLRSLRLAGAWLGAWKKSESKRDGVRAQGGGPPKQ